MKQKTILLALVILWSWLWIKIISGCSSVNHNVMHGNYVHSTKNMVVVSIDHENGTILVRGETIFPQGGFYYVNYPIEELGYLQENSLLELKEMKK